MDWLVLSGFLMGWAVGWVRGYFPERAKVKVLRSLLDLEREKVRLSEKDLRWEKVKVQALRLDLERVQEKNSEKAREMVQDLMKVQDLGKDWEQRKVSDWDSAQPLELESQTDLDLLSDLAKESARQEREKANWKAQG